jgi:hypothetical protein
MDKGRDLLLLAAKKASIKKVWIGVTDPNGEDRFETLEDLKAKWSVIDNLYIIGMCGNNYAILDLFHMPELNEINFATDKTTYSYTGTQTISRSDRPLLVKGWGSKTTGSYTTIGTGALYCNGRHTTFEDLIYNASVYGGVRGTVAETWIKFKNTDSNKSGIYGGSVASNETSVISGDVYIEAENPRASAISVYGSYTANTGNLRTDGDVYLNIINGTYNYISPAGQTATNAGAKTMTLQKLNTHIHNGTFIYVIGGPAGNTPSITTTCKDISLVIDGGTFSTNVAGGLYTHGSGATVNGDINVEINGGTFNCNVAGGCIGTSTSASTHSLVSGNVSVVLNGGTFYKDIIAGSLQQGPISGNTYLEIGEDVVFAGDDCWMTGASQMGSNATPYVSGSRKLKVKSNRTLNVNVGPGAFTEMEIVKGYTPTFTKEFNLSFTDLNVHTSSHLTSKLSGDLMSFTLCEDEGAESGEVVSYEQGFTPGNPDVGTEFKVYVKDIHGTKTEATKVSDYEYRTNDWIIEIAQDYTTISYRRNI